MRRQAQVSPFDAAPHRWDTAASRRIVGSVYAATGPRFAHDALPQALTRPRAPHPVSQLLAGVPSDPGRSHGAARVRACEARPQALHPAPPQRRLARAPLVERDGDRYIIL